MEDDRPSSPLPSCSSYNPKEEGEEGEDEEQEAKDDKRSSSSRKTREKSSAELAEESKCKGKRRENMSLDREDGKFK